MHEINSPKTFLKIDFFSQLMEHFYKNVPDAAYLFAWNHKDEIFKKEGGFNGEWFSHVSL